MSSLGIRFEDLGNGAFEVGHSAVGLIDIVHHVGSARVVIEYYLHIHIRIQDPAYPRVECIHKLLRRGPSMEDAGSRKAGAEDIYILLLGVQAESA
ncbi:hypothetical protein MRX96_054853 [Rhipicephalus microplus]